PGLARLSQQDGSALWQVDREVARATIVPASGSGTPRTVAAGPVDIHTTIPSGADGRVLRLADSAADGWTATLDGKPLTRTTVDGWAQGFELPATGGRLDVTYEDPIGHTAWLWAQGLLAVVLVVLALPGRRRDIDDDLPDEPAVPAQAVAGEGRRARRLRAQAEAEAEGADRPEEFPPPQPEQPPASVPQQNQGQWDPAGYPGGEYTGYGDQYQNVPYPADAYGQQYQADPYQGGQYDPYAYGGQAPAPSYDQQGYDQAYTQGYGTPYDPAQQHHPHGTGSERPDGSQQ
ncbi:family 2 glycosyl transferase, partial [Streptomyces sp. NPDC006386]